MKYILSCIYCFAVTAAMAQADKAPNIFIITTDGFRWQEIFNGADSLLINNPTYVKDTALLKQLYWDNDTNERRKMLMPFVWRTIARQGSLYGNRNYQNKVSVANSYRFSYAGYNELLTGYADPAIISNRKKWNTNEHLLDFLNSQPEYRNRVAAFASWNMFAYILNKQKSAVYMNSGYQPADHDSLSVTEQVNNAIQADAMDNTVSTRNDMLSFVTAKEYIRNKHPKVVYIGFGETDEYAHGGNYDGYLQSAHLFDEYLAQLWYFVNQDPFYKNNTSFIITTDHGRGERTKNWVRHGLFTTGSNSTWLMTIGPGFEARGELQNKAEIFNAQLAQTIAQLLGYYFEPAHPVDDPLSINAR